MERGVHGPPALTRLRDGPADALEVLAVKRERPPEPLDETRLDDRPAIVDGGCLGQIERVAGCPEHGKPLSDGLHHAVLDAVVDHLHEVARAGAGEEAEAVVDRDGRPQLAIQLEVLPIATDHQTRPRARTRGAAGDAHVDESDAPPREALSPA
jgi:hypothetical protein